MPQRQASLANVFAVAVVVVSACGKLGYDVPDQGDDSLSLRDASAGAAGWGGATSTGGAGGFAPDAMLRPIDASSDGKVLDADASSLDASFLDASFFGCPPGVTTSGISFTTAMHGGSSGTPYTDACPAGQAIVGFTGYTTTTQPIVVGWLQGLCGKLSIVASSNTCQIGISPGSTFPGRGQAGGTGPWVQMCPQNQVVVAFHGRAGIDLDQVSFECAPLTLAKTGSTYQITTGTPTSLPPQGGPTGPTFQDGCPPDQVAVTSNVQAGQIIYELGLSCATLTLTP
jgi:hypothetical protein